METSEQINEITAALSAAQGEMKPAIKTAVNAAFARGSNPGSKYATLADCSATALPVLSKHKLALIQGIHGTEFVCRVAHASGQWIQIRVPIPGDLTKITIQQLGAITTYFRRQTMSLIGVVPDDDDDGNEAAKAGTFGKPANGIGVHSPLGDVEINDEVIAYADSLREATDPAIIRQLAADLRAEGEQVYRAVWSLLDSKVRSNIKRIIEAKVAA